MSRYNHDCYIFSFTVDNFLRIGYLVAPDKKKFKKQYKGRMKMEYYLKQLPYDCWHLELKDIDETTLREYTPISSWNNLRDNSNLDLLIKLYPEGQMSKILSKANIGTKFFIGPPKLTVPSYFFNDITNATAYACIAGGTGITPFAQMIKLIEHKLSIGEKAPKLTLLYSNKKEEDILLKEELMEYVKKMGDHLKVIFTLTREEKSGYLFGRVNADLIERFLSPKLHTHIFVSGPEGMWDTLLPLFIEKGYDKFSCTELEA